jgi:hypothetical protein
MNKQAALLACALSALLTSSAAAKPRGLNGLPELDGHPALTSLSCNTTLTLCMHRVVVQIPHSAIARENNDVPPGCLPTSADVMSDLVSKLLGGKRSKGSKAAEKPTDPRVELAKAGLKLLPGAPIGQLGGTVGAILSHELYGEDTGTCAILIAPIPEGATDVAVYSSVFDRVVSPKEWINCPSPMDLNPNFCQSPGFIGWSVPPHKSSRGVVGTIVNWSHDRERYVAMDVRYKPPKGFLPPRR